MQPRRLPDVFSGIQVKAIHVYDGFGLVVLPEVRQTTSTGAYTVLLKERFRLFATR